MAQYKYDVIIGELRLDLAFDILPSMGGAAPQISGRLLIFPRRWQQRHISIFFDPNPDIPGEYTPHITLEDGRVIWLPSFSMEQAAAWGVHMQRVMLDAFLRRAEPLSSQEIQAIGVFRPKNDDVLANMFAEAAKTRQWRVTGAKIERITRGLWDEMDLVPLDQTSPAPGRPQFGFLFRDDESVEPVTVGFFPAGLPRSIDETVVREGGLYRMPERYLDEDVVAAMFAPCGPGFWTALRDVARFSRVRPKMLAKINELEGKAIALRAQ